MRRTATVAMGPGFVIVVLGLSNFVVIPFVVTSQDAFLSLPRSLDLLGSMWLHLSLLALLQSVAGAVVIVAEFSLPRERPWSRRALEMLHWCAPVLYLSLGALYFYRCGTFEVRPFDLWVIPCAALGFPVLVFSSAMPTLTISFLRSRGLHEALRACQATAQLQD